MFLTVLLLFALWKKLIGDLHLDLTWQPDMDRPSSFF
jgi:hypothetical protein